VLQNGRGATAEDEAVSSGASLAVRAALRFGPWAAWLREQLGMTIEDSVPEADGDDAEGELKWKIYQERLESGSKLLSFEEGGDGVRRRT